MTAGSFWGEMSNGAGNRVKRNFVQKECRALGKVMPPDAYQTLLLGLVAIGKSTS